MSKDKAAGVGRMSAVTWTRVETGETVRDLSYIGVSKALGWTDSSCIDYIERGAEPVPVEDLIGDVDIPAQSQTVRLRGVLDEINDLEPAELTALISKAAEAIAEKQSRSSTDGG